MLDDVHRLRAARKVVRLLLVEDDDADARIFEIVGRMMTSFDLRITRVKDVRAALTALSETQFDLCMVDYWLEHGSSARLMCALDERRDVGVVVLSHALPAEIRRMGVLAGDTLFLSKADCSPDRLSRAVAEAMPRPAAPAAQATPELRIAV